MEVNDLKIAVFGSGKGSNFRAIVEQVRNAYLSCKLAVVISDVKDAGIMKLADEFGISRYFIKCVAEKAWQIDAKATDKILGILRKNDIKLIVLAGFMRIIPKSIVAEYPRRIINLHPSLLPKHKGREAWKKALLAGDKESGVTVHFVNEELDAGEIILQQAVEIRANDDAESLHKRLQIVERKLLPQAIRILTAEILSNDLNN